MCHKCMQSFLAAVIIVFAIWETSASMWIIIVSAAIIFVYQILDLYKDGCYGFCLFGKKTGSELFMEEADEELHEGPSRKELRETLKNKKK